MRLVCPACGDYLSPMPVGELIVDVCQGGCGGIWFDHFELQKVDQPDEPEGRGLLHIQARRRLKVDPTKKRKCPKCFAIYLKRRPFSPQIPVEIDECGNCGGIWLDAGELEAIRRKTEAQDEPTRPSRVVLARFVYQYISEIQDETAEPGT